jgi:hypothetical protein
MVGFAMAVLPVSAETITTDTSGLKAGEVSIPKPGPSQTRAEAEGNAYFEREFSKLDYIKKATIET